MNIKSAINGNTFLIKDIIIPSVNHYFKSDRNGRKWVTKEALEFKERVREAASHFELITGDVSLAFTWYAKKKGRGDLDNKFKCILDALNGIAYDDDKQIIKLLAEKRANSGFDGLRVTASEILQYDNQNPMGARGLTGSDSDISVRSLQR
jgi:Holliday junction resolvase RusA-like endonuclease